jgi:BED zinc finger
MVSWVWEHFEKIFGTSDSGKTKITKGICKHCNAELITSGGSTSGLMKHLTTVHKLMKDEDYDENSKTREILGLFIIKTVGVLFE